ncbi:MAG: hypothetical protein HC840_01190 [Leptolyngbyaceae cyanobacterium RM2_2_4]|nr:hypothetical protein [Leptolyngbyaceae cyanobacterium RM2_2_4]
MATFAAIKKDYFGGSPTGRSFLIVHGTLTLSAEGGAVTDIPASVFGLNKLLASFGGIKSDNSQVQDFAVTADGKALVSRNVETATDADRANPADLTGNWVLTVIGY